MTLLFSFFDSDRCSIRFATYITIAAKRLAEQWDKVKNDPDKKRDFIKELQKDAKELRDKGFLSNPRGVDDDEE